MTPRQFYERFGQPKVTTFVGTNADVTVAVANPDRYLLMFLTDGGAVLARPQIDGGQLDTGFSFQGRVSDILTHAIHGSLVAAEWRAVPLGLGVNLTVVEGFMREGRE